ncbi:hypothetical protein AAFF27_18610 [Xylophilus sp. GW821-FHT01B05]
MQAALRTAPINVGYIGLGAMDGALAGRLCADQALHVWYLNRQASANWPGNAG